MATRTRTPPAPAPEAAAITEWVSPTGALLRQLATTEGDVTFVAKDVCDALGIVNASKACEVLDEDEKGISTVRTLGGDQQMLTVTEPGLYRLILKSRKPEAKAFDRWVRHEVLPSIRKTGSYQAPAPAAPKAALVRAPSSDDIMAGLVTQHGQLLQALQAYSAPSAGAVICTRSESAVPRPGGVAAVGPSAM